MTPPTRFRDDYPRTFWYLVVLSVVVAAAAIAQVVCSR